MSSEVMVLSDIIDRDLYVYESGDEAIEEIKEMMANTNRCILFNMWTIGKFVTSRKLSAQYGMTIQDVAEAIGSHVKTIRRYKTIYNHITADQLKRLALLKVSGNAVLAYAEIADKDPETAPQLLECMMNGDLPFTKDVDEAYTQALIERNRSYNLLPGGEPPQAPELFGDIDDDLAEAEKASTNPADSIIDVTEVEGEYEDYDSSDKEEEEESQYSADAKRLLSKAKPIIAALRRDFKNISEDMSEQYAKLEEIHSVVMGNKKVSDEFEDLVVESYQELARAAAAALQQLHAGFAAGYINQPTDIDRTAAEVVGNGIVFHQEE